MDNSEFETVLVVEAHITTEDIEQSIRVTETARYGDIFEGTIKGVIGAKVALRDDLGNNIRFIHTENGFYFGPDNFKAEIGRKYILTIEVDDKSYNSLPEAAIEAVDLDSLYTTFNKYPVVTSTGNVDYQGGTDVYARFRKTSSTASHYMWKYSGTYLIKTYPELYVGGMPPTPMPKSCCADCWQTESGSQLILSSFPRGSDLTDAELFFLPDDGYRFYNKYVLAAKRYSLSQEAYNFYQLLESQISISGDIFDAPPAIIRGNILNIDNIDEPVVGYFTVSDVKADTIEILGVSLPERSGLPVFPDDCLVLPRTTTTQPVYW
ncbi:MAG: DUF4249 domain-containing protein [Reichenbachiella sp.]|uniref:DUF4249 domain-containing protein n=1 Tax=Reichenbachiella sp. TaxID=2184521 RepID=UPI0032969835